MGAYEIIIFGNLEFANSIMMGVARLANNASGAGLEYAAASIFFLAILLAFIRYYMNPERTSHPGKEFFLGIVLFLLFVSSEVSPKVDVILTSPYGFDVDYAGPPSYYIEDVPVIAALPAWVTTNLFHGIKETVKQEFVSPNYDGTFSANEILSSLVRLHDNGYAAAGLDHRVDAALSEYINQCVIPYTSMNSDGSIFLNSIINSELHELWNNMQVTWDVPMVEHSLGSGGETVTEDCTEAYTSISNVIANEDSDFGVSLLQHFHNSRVTPNTIWTANHLLFDNDIGNPYKLMLNGYLSYTLGETTSKSSLAHWSNLMVFEGQRQRAYQRAGEASLWLNIMIPTITAIETFAFYIAPFVVIMAMAGSYGFKMIIGYLTLVVYINMWGFVQIFTDWYTVSSVSAVFNGSKLSVQNFTPTVVEIESYLSTAAALTASIPMLSTLLLYGGVHSLMGVMRNMTAGNVDSSRPAPSVAQSLNNGAGAMANLSGTFNSETGLYNQGRSSVSDNATMTMDLNSVTSGSLSATSSEAKQNTMSALNSQTEAFKNEVGSAFSELQAAKESGSESFTRTDEAGMVARLADDFQRTLGVSDTHAQKLAMAAHLQATAGFSFGFGENGDNSKFNVGAGAGVKLSGSVEGAVQNQMGISQKELESIQQSTGESEKFNEVWQRAQETASQWNNSNSESTSTLAQSVYQWNDSYTQAEQIGHTASNIQSQSLGLRLDSVSANSVLNHSRGGAGSFYDDIFNELKGMYTNLNGGDEQKALAQMQEELNISGAGDIRRLGADGQGRTNTINALGNVITQLQKSASDSGDLNQVAASKGAIANIFEKAAGRAGQLNDPNVETYFNQMATALRSEFLSESARNAVNTSNATGPDMNGLSREAVASSSTSDVTRVGPDGEFISTEAVNQNINSGRDRVQGGLSSMLETLGRSNMGIYSFADPVSGWEKLENPRDDIAGQSMFNLGRLATNMTNNMDTGGDVGTAFGEAVRNELREQGIGNADAVGRGITTLMNQSPADIHRTAAAAANGDRQALSQLMDVRAAQAFMSTTAGSSLITDALRNVEDSTSNRFMNNVGESAGAVQNYNDTARGFEGEGMTVLDSVIARTDTGSDISISRGHALNAIQFAKGMELSSNTAALQTASMAAEGRFGDALGSKALGVDEIPSSQEERTAVRDEAVRNYLREHDSGPIRGGINGSFEGEDAINQRMRDLQREMTTGAFGNEVISPAATQFFSTVAGTSIDLDIKNPSSSDTNKMSALPGANGMEIDGLKGMQSLHQLAARELESPGISQRTVPSVAGRQENQDAIQMANQYGGELRAMVQQMEQSATTEGGKLRVEAYSRAIDSLESTAIRTPGAAIQLPAEVGQAVREGNAPQTIEARGQSFELQGFKDNMVVYSDSWGEGSFYVASGVNSLTDMLRYSSEPITPTRDKEGNVIGQGQSGDGNTPPASNSSAEDSKSTPQGGGELAGDSTYRFIMSPEATPGTINYGGMDYGQSHLYSMQFGGGMASPPPVASQQTAAPAGSGNVDDTAKPEQVATAETSSAAMGTNTPEQADAATNANTATQAGTMAPVTDNPAPVAQEPTQTAATQPTPATPAGSGNVDDTAKPEQVATAETSSAAMGTNTPEKATNDKVSEAPASSTAPQETLTSEAPAIQDGTASQALEGLQQSEAIYSGVADNESSPSKRETGEIEQSPGVEANAGGYSLGAGTIMVDGQELSSTSLTTAEGLPVYEDVGGNQMVYDPQTNTATPYSDEAVNVGSDSDVVNRSVANPDAESSVTKASTQGGGDKFVPLSKRDVMEMDDMALSDLRSGVIPESLEVGTSTLTYAGIFGTPEDPMGHIYVDEMGNAYFNNGFDGRLKPYGDIEDVEYTPMKPPKL